MVVVVGVEIVAGVGSSTVLADKLSERKALLLVQPGILRKPRILEIGTALAFYA